MARGGSSAKPWVRSKDGYVLTTGEFNAGVYGVRAPILTDQKIAVGSLEVTWNVKEVRDVEVQHTVLAVKQAATAISERLLEKQRHS